MVLQHILINSPYREFTSDNKFIEKQMDKYSDIVCIYNVQSKIYFDTTLSTK